jgi:hypothetical protein
LQLEIELFTPTHCYAASVSNNAFFGPKGCVVIDIKYATFVKIIFCIVVRKTAHIAENVLNHD